MLKEYQAYFVLWFTNPELQIEDLAVFVFFLAQLYDFFKI